MEQHEKLARWQAGSLKSFVLPRPARGLGALSLIIAAYLAIGIQYAVLTPRWQVPDEPAHYNYVRYIVENRSLPTLDPGEYDQGYLAWLTSAGFPAYLPVGSLQYESWQPPLYYLLAAPVYLISNGELLPLRLFSLALGAGVVIFTYLAVREVFPDQSLLALTAAGFVAFIPQHIAMMAGVNNDSLSEFVIALGLWRILRVRHLGFGRWDMAMISAILAAAFLTKSQAYVLAPVAASMIILNGRRNLQAHKPDGTGQAISENKMRPWLAHIAMVFLPALLTGALWWGRNISVYGWPDFMASIRHDQVVAAQPRTQQWIAKFGRMEVLRRFGQTTFQSFWGQFGWMGIVMDRRVYWALGVYSGIITLGAVFAVARRRIQSNADQLDAVLLLLISGLLTLTLYLFYNITYVQHQGRYLFPALVPIGLAAAISLQWWGGIAEAVTRQRVGWAAPAGALAAMASLSLLALYRFIIPAF